MWLEQIFGIVVVILFILEFISLFFIFQKYAIFIGFKAFTGPANHTSLGQWNEMGPMVLVYKHPCSGTEPKVRYYKQP
jgi:hypothetical protein